MIDAEPTLLLVEDNPDDVELTRRAFARSNILGRMVVAQDGEEALDYLFGTGAHTGRNPLDLPRIVLLDLKLPKISGLDVLRRIRADNATRRVPVIILTTSREERDILSSYDLGANSYVRKPIDFTLFVEAARTLGYYWLALNECPPASGERP